ncbi:MAG TPA: LysM peptidoglycan-binding domain-containing protein [Anaerolineales bacterium]|nr:LysM peptidoglycan-binding domain-containing protein [Anaerolineales bacterium]
MKAHFPLILCVITLFFFFLSILLPFGGAQAAPDAQFVTATPGPDGRILYVVVEGDSCLQVALLHGITVQQIRQFNTRLDENCTLTVGQQLVVGLAQPEAPTAGPAPTLPSPTVTATPVSGTTEVCVLLFNDLNGDAVRQETELGIEGGAVSLTNLNGSYSETQNTVSAVDPDTLLPVRSCFVDVPNGEYNVSMAVPDEYNPTMALSYTLNVKAGDLAEISFGAQSKTITVSETTDSQEGNRSSLLGVFGFLLLLGGAGLGYYAYRSGQPKSKLKGSPLTKR